RAANHTRERHARLCRTDFVWQHFPARRERQPVHRAAAIRDRASDNRIRSVRRNEPLLDGGKAGETLADFLTKGLPFPRLVADDIAILEKLLADHALQSPKFLLDGGEVGEMLADFLTKRLPLCRLVADDIEILKQHRLDHESVVVVPVKLRAVA